jgi:hypothetical protein
MHDVSICLLNRPDFPRDLEASKEAHSRQGLISPLLADTCQSPLRCVWLYTPAHTLSDRLNFAGQIRAASQIAPPAR